MPAQSMTLDGIRQRGECLRPSDRPNCTLTMHSNVHLARRLPEERRQEWYNKLRDAKLKSPRRLTEHKHFLKGDIRILKKCIAPDSERRQIWGEFKDLKNRLGYYEDRERLLKDLWGCLQKKWDEEDAANSEWEDERDLSSEEILADKLRVVKLENEDV